LHRDCAAGVARCFPHLRAVDHPGEAEIVDGAWHGLVARRHLHVHEPPARPLLRRVHTKCAEVGSQGMPSTGPIPIPALPTSRWRSNRGTRLQRSSSRAACSNSEGNFSPSRAGTGGPRSSRSPCGTETRPAALNVSRMLRSDEGMSSATGRPYSVT
jgi:hypothetical protein